MFFFPLAHFYDADPEQERKRMMFSLDTYNMKKKYFLFLLTDKHKTN
jgi:hypothetical protein